ncbi:MAG: hypothetical protein PVF49_06815 [Anaerolineales bacterium]|jgi:hypothetical protein
MRGKKISKEMKKLDMVLTAVRYAGQGKKIETAKGYERFGQVWTDLKLYDRETLADRLGKGQRVVTGQLSDLAGQFVVFKPVHLQGKNGGGTIVANGAGSGGDDLGLPLF